ncbi:MAG: ABC transporter substrate-binding protein [Nitrospinota bacterium]
MKKGSFLPLRRSIILLAVFALSMGAFGRASAESVKFMLNWVPDGQQSAWFSAKEKGFYKKAGLDVTLMRGFGSAKTVKAVAGKAAEFGLADAGEIIKGRAKDIAVRAIGVFYAKDLNVIYTLQGSGIQTPKDLEGRTIGAPVWSSLRTVFPLLAKVNKVNAAKVKWVSMPPSGMRPSLLAGKVDSIATFTASDRILVEEANKLGKKIGRIIFADWGVNLYSLVLTALDERIQNNPDQVRRFVHASIQGMAWAAKHPDQAVRILRKVYPQGTHESELFKWKLAMNSMLTEGTMTHGIGYINPGKMKFTRDAILGGLGISKEVPVGDLYTNRFLPKGAKE